MLEQDVDGLIGWWLCSLHGRQGIAPGNRLQEIKRRSDGQSSPEVTSQTSEVFTFADVDYDVPRSQEAGEDYAIPRGIRSPDYDVPNANIPDGYGDVYDIPSDIASQGIDIDTKQYEIENALDNFSPSDEVYDVPTSLGPDDSFTQEIYDIPSKEQGDVESINPTAITSPPDHSKDNRAGELSPVPHQGTLGGESESPGEPGIYSEIYDVPSPSGDEDLKKENRNSVELQKAKKPLDVVSRLSAASSDGKRQSSSSTDSAKLSSDDDYVDYQDIYGDGRERDVNVYDVPIQVGLKTAHLGLATSIL